MDNQHISALNKNPWRGLNFYTEKDKDDFFGRDEEIQRLSLYVINNTQSVLYGKSGIGKSSIIQAGIFPIARENRMLPISIRLSHGNEQSYIEQIRTKFTEEIRCGRLQIKEIVPRVNGDKESLWEYFHRHLFLLPETGATIRPLIVFDQFEEIFTLQKNEKFKLAFFSELADLLNEVKPQYIVDAENETSNQYKETSKNPDGSFELDFGSTEKDEKRQEYAEISNFNIVFVIREDFLAHLERYTKYIPAMKTNRFALLPLNEEQAAEIIMEPRAGLLSAEVAELIIQKVTQRQDFHLGDEPEIEVDAVVLSLYLSQLYEKRGDNGVITKEMVNDYGSTIIRNFYESSVCDLPQNEIELLEDLLLTYDGRRNNVSVRDLVREGVSKQVLDTLTEERKLLRLFNYQNDNRIEYMHDVLCQVVSDRVNQRELHRAQQGERLQKRRNRIMRWGIVVMVLLLAGIGFYIWDNNFRIIEKNYGIVVKENGWFKGLESLTQEEASYRAYHYVLKYEGRKNLKSEHPFAMEARDGYGKLTTNHTICPYILNQFDETDTGVDLTMLEKIRTICQWEFIPDRSGEFLLQEKAKDKDGKIIYAYNRSKTNEKNKILGTYTDDFGFPLMLRDSSYFYLLVTYNNKGYEKLIAFYDEHGYPIMNKDSAYQSRFAYTEQGIEMGQASYLFDGRPMMDRFGNCGYLSHFDKGDSLHVTGVTYFNAEFKPCRSTNQKVVTQKYKYDDHWRIIEDSYWDEDNKPDTCAYGYHACCQKFNNHGQVIHWYLLDSNGDTLKHNNDGYYQFIANYDEWGNQVYLECWIQNRKDVSVSKYHKERCLFLENFTIYHNNPNDTIWTYKYQVDTINNIDVTIDYAEQLSKRETYDKRGNIIKVEYYDVTNIIPTSNKEGWHVNEMQYKYVGDTTYISDICYDLDDIMTYHHEWIIDSALYTKSDLSYANGSFQIGHRYSYDDKTFSQTKAYERLDSNWRTTRYYSDEYDGFFYRMNFVNSIKPSYSHSDELIMYAQNEFGEPSLVRVGDYTYYARYKYCNNEIYYDEFGRSIDPSIDNWPILGYVVQKPGKFLGFLTGDIVLACNDWSMRFDSQRPFSNTNWWTEENRDFIVARYNSIENDYDTIHIIVPAYINNIIDYISFRKCRCTKHEQNRIQKLLDTKINFPMGLGVINDSTCEAYKIGMRKPFLLLDYGGWNFEKNTIEELSDSVASYANANRRVIYIDYETDTIGSFESDVDTLGIHFKRFPIDPKYYKFIQKKYHEYKQKL